MIDDPWFYVAAVPALLLIGASKGGFGGGLGIVGVPMLALVIPPVQAAAILLPILCLMDLFSVAAYRNNWDRANMKILVPGALVGIAAGTATFGLLEDAYVVLLVAVIALGFTLNHWLAPHLDRWLRRGAAEARRPAVVRGGIWSGFAGYTSFVAHAGGPPLSVYLLPQQMDRTLFVGTTVVFFLVVNYVKLVPYAALGQFDLANLSTSLVLMPLAPVGVALGVFMHRRINEVLFFRAVYVFLFATGLKLLYDGVTGL